MLNFPEYIILLSLKLPHKPPKQLFLPVPKHAPKPPNLAQEHIILPQDLHIPRILMFQDRVYGGEEIDGFDELVLVAGVQGSAGRAHGHWGWAVVGAAEGLDGGAVGGAGWGLGSLHFC